MHLRGTPRILQATACPFGLTDYLQQQGDDDTFGPFPQHLRDLTSVTLPAVNVVTLVYPKYETRGDLKECVGRFREWYVLLSTIFYS